MTARRGMTLIEVTIALAIAATLFAAVVIGIGALTGAQAKESTTQLAGVVRALYDSAALTGRTCRLVFELPGEKDEDGAVTYRAECAKGARTALKDRDRELRELDRREKRDQASKDDQDFRSRRLDSDDAPTVQELMDREKQRVDDQAKYADYADDDVQEHTLPSSVRLSVWTRHQQKPVSSGPAYLYFFPQGFTERAQIAVKQGSNVWTLTVQPLTGKVAVVPDELEVPRS